MQLINILLVRLFCIFLGGSANDASHVRQPDNPGLHVRFTFSLPDAQKVDVLLRTISPGIIHGAYSGFVHGIARTDKGPSL